MQIYKHLFFDLDNTLFDFDACARLTIIDLFKVFNLQQWFESAKAFADSFEKHNSRLWDAYRLGEVKKQEVSLGRFEQTLLERTSDANHLVPEMADYFLNNTTNKGILVDGALDTLTYLKSRYRLHIISNGFNEVQHKKLSITGLAPFFTSVMLSEQAKAQKPSAAFFHLALSNANARKKESLIIGDLPETDIEGGRNYGIDTVYFNYDKRTTPVNATYTINHLNELKQML